jgi:hypothetical protein
MRRPGMQRQLLRAFVLGVALVLASSISPGSLEAQHTQSLRATPEQLTSAILLRPEMSRGADPTPAIWRQSSTTRGALIGGGIGLVLSAVAVVLYVEGTDPGNYSGPVLPFIAGATALGAVIGAAIGAGSSN